MSTLKTNINKSPRNVHSLYYLRSIRSLFARPTHLKILIALLLILFTVIAFSQLRHNEFINLDDDLYVTKNSHVQEGLTLRSVYWAFSSTANGQWTPMTFLSHMVDYTFFRLNAGGHHFASLLFHTINTLLLFLLLHRMTGALWKSALVALIFGLHPLHVESVAWVAERKDVLHLLFLLIAIWFYLNYVENGKWFLHICVLLSFILALMSKPMAVTLPVILILLDYWPLGRLKIERENRSQRLFTNPWSKEIKQNIPIRQLLIEKASLFSVAVASGLFTLFSVWRIRSLPSFESLPFIFRIQNATVSYTKYILKLLWPNSLAVLYPYPTTVPIWEVVCATLLLLAITVLVALYRRKCPYLIIGWLWYLITLLPVIGLLQAGHQAMADRFTYMPMIGLLIMMTFGIADIFKGWLHKRLAFALLSLSLVMALIVLTRAQVKLWRNSETLLRHTLHVTDNNYFIHNHLGAVLFKQGNDQEALIHFNRSLEINPYFADAYCNRGVLLLGQGKYREAMPSFIAALKNKPYSVEALTNLGIIFGKYGKVKEATDYFSTAISIEPDYEEAYFNQGNLFLEIKEYREAIQYYQKALTINSKNYKTYNNLGIALSGLGNPKKAMECYHKALDINPDDADTHCNLGGLFIQQGKYEQAILQLTEALRIKPNDGEIHFTLGMLHLKMGRKELALNQYAALKNINSKMADTLYRNISKYKN